MQQKLTRRQATQYDSCLVHVIDILWQDDRILQLFSDNCEPLYGPNCTMFQYPPSGTVLMEDDQEAKPQSIDSTSLRLKRKPSQTASCRRPHSASSWRSNFYDTWHERLSAGGPQPSRLVRSMMRSDSRARTGLKASTSATQN
jgi:hypothetical protein